MVSFVIMGLVLKLCSAGNCVGHRCQRNARRIKGVPEEEMEVLELLGNRSDLTTSADLFVTESRLSHEVDIVNPDTQTDAHDPSLKEQHVSRVESIHTMQIASSPIPIEMVGLIGSFLPSHGFMFEFVSDGTTIRKIDTLDVVEISRRLDQGGSEMYIGRINLVSDCRENHSVDKLITVADALIPLRISPSYLLTVGGTYVDYDHLYECHRTRRAIVWELVEGFMSVNALRRSCHDKQVPPHRAFEITRMIIDMIYKMHKAGVSHGNLTPLNVCVGEGRTMIMNLKGAGFTKDGMSRDMQSAFQILIDMNPGIYTRYAIKPLNNKDAEYHKNLGELRTALMGKWNMDTLVNRYTTARAIVDSLISLV